MQQNPSFDFNNAMEIESLKGPIEQGKGTENLFETPKKQFNSKIEDEMDDSLLSPHFTQNIENHANSNMQKQILDKENAAKLNQDEFQTKNEISQQDYAQFTPKKNECLFQDLNNLIVQVQERMQNLSVLSPGTNELSQCNGTYSEIKQQLFEIEKVYRSKDDELSQLNIQLEKEFNSCKNQKNVDLTLNSQLNQTFDIYKRYQYLQEIKKIKLQKFKKKYQENYNQLRSDFNELKSLVKSLFKSSSFSFEKEQFIIEFTNKFNLKSQIQEENLDNDYLIYQIDEDFNQESILLKNVQNSDWFVQDLMKLYNINENNQDVEIIKKQIIDCAKKQKEHLDIIHSNQNLSANQQIMKLKTKINELENELIQLNQDKESQQKAINQLELLVNKDFVDVNTQLFKQQLKKMEQQQKLITMSSIITQQLFKSTSFESDLNTILNEKNYNLINYFDKANELINDLNWLKIDDPLKYIKFHSQNVQEMMDIICREYSKMIRQIQQQRDQFMSQL